MTVALPEGVETKRSGRRVYRYWNPHRGTELEGERHALGGNPEAEAGSPEFVRFWNELRAAMNKTPCFPLGSIGAMCDLWEASSEFKANSPSTQKGYKSCLRRFARPEGWGLWRADDLTPQDIVMMRDAMAETPGMANEMLSVGRTMYRWAIPLGHAKTNPFDSVAGLLKADVGHVPWPKWVSDYVIQHAPVDLVRLARLGMMTCQRESDLIRMATIHRERNGIWCRPRKTKKKRKAFHIPLTTADQFELDRWAETPMVFKAKRWKQPIARHHEELYLYSPKGAPYSTTSLRARYNRWLNTTEGQELRRLWQEWLTLQVRKYDWEIDPEDYTQPTIHGLRGTGILVRFAAGYDVEQISNDIGMSRQMVTHYMRFKDQMQVAADGRARLKLA